MRPYIETKFKEAKYMVTDFNELVALCDEELQQREYEYKYYQRIKQNWDALGLWMKSNNHSEFNEDIGNKYCDESLGTHKLHKRAHVSLREKVRSVRMLVSYQQNGDFEFRCPRVEYVFEGEIGKIALNYLEFCSKELLLAEKTIENKRLYLYDFCRYLNSINLEIDNINTENTESFFAFMKYSLSSRHNAANNLRKFLRYIYDEGHSCKDTSVYVLPDNYKKACKLPTTYEEDEIKDLIASVERASAIGKRVLNRYFYPYETSSQLILIDKL